MSSLYSKYIKLINATGDTVLLTTASISAYLFTHAGNSALSGKLFEFTLFSIFAWFLCASLSGAYKFYRITNILHSIFNVIKITILYLLLLEATLNILNITVIPRDFLTANYITLFLLICLSGY